ncbi:Helix-turn-helix domain protein [compost metagenome]
MEDALATFSRIDDASSSAQRLRLLARLKCGPVDTFTAIRDLNIVRPGARIAELRSAGHSIKTQRITLTDDQGRTHHGIALYYLINTQNIPHHQPHLSHGSHPLQLLLNA